MRRLWAGVLAFSLGGLALAWDDSKTEGKQDPPSRADRLKAVQKEYDTAMRGYSAKFREAREVEDKDKQKEMQQDAIKTFSEARKKAGEAAWAIVEEDAKDGVGLDSLVFMLGNVATADQAKKARELITDYHVANPNVSKAIGTLSRGADGKAFLLAVLDKNPGTDAKGLACYYLGNAALTAAEKEKDKEKLAALEKEGIAYFDRVVKEFPDAILYGTTKIGPKADGAMFAYRNLSVGLTVPEVEGEDVDGAKFKLSDYRGKVVMIDFWGHW